MPRFRFTMRGLMVAVAIVGVAIGAEVMRRRRDAYREAAFSWRNRQHSHHRLADIQESYATADKKASDAYARTARDFPDADARMLAATGTSARKRSEERAKEAAEFLRQAARLRARASREGEVVRKYERAARSPWLPVAPDPPELAGDERYWVEGGRYLMFNR